MEASMTKLPFLDNIEVINRKNLELEMDNEDKFHDSQNENKM